MSDKFFIKKAADPTADDEYVNMTIRVTTGMRNAFDELAVTSNKSRNAIIVEALNYALEQLEIVDEGKKK